MHRIFPRCFGGRSLLRARNSQECARS